MNLSESCLIIRHADREEINNLFSSEEIPIKKSGRIASFKLGESLAKENDEFNLYYSPYTRCRETAFFIKKGIEKQGKKVIRFVLFDSLKPFFNHDLFFIETICRKYSIEEYFKLWYEEKIPIKVALPCKISAITMLSDINSEKCKNKIFITHDWNIFCLQSLYRSSFEDFFYPRFLEGVLYSRKRKTIDNFDHDL
jgi:hypothetical protein